MTFDRNTKEPKIAEELTFAYYVLLKNERFTEDKKPTLLTATIVHTNVPQDKGLHSVTFVSPRALASFFDGKTPTTTQQTITDIGKGASDDDRHGIIQIRLLHLAVYFPIFDCSV